MSKTALILSTLSTVVVSSSTTTSDVTTGISAIKSSCVIFPIEGGKSSVTTEPSALISTSSGVYTPLATTTSGVSLTLPTAVSVSIFDICCSISD